MILYSVSKYSCSFSEYGTLRQENGTEVPQIDTLTSLAVEVRTGQTPSQT